jgi:predicted metal-binding membrane protein
MVGDPAQVARLPELDRVRFALIGALLGLALLAWLWVDRRMAGMDAGPGTDPGTLGFYVVSWMVMMAAMMLPSIAPMVLVFAHVQRRRTERGAGDRAVSTSLFVTGYLVVWTVVGLVAYGLFAGTKSLSVEALRWSSGGRYLAGAVLLAAALYELTPAKDACLRRCRGPLDFVMEHWREGQIGALQMGALHGSWCVGCCWALMAALFALGVMSLTWMAVIAAAIAAEKLLTWPRAAKGAIAALLAIAAAALVIAPGRVPGLTVPGSPAAARAMSNMRMQPGTSSPDAGDSRRMPMRQGAHMPSR